MGRIIFFPTLFNPHSNEYSISSESRLQVKNGGPGLQMIQDFSLLTLIHAMYIKSALQVKNGGPGLQMIQGVDGQDGAGEPPLVSNLGFERRLWKTQESVES